MPPPSPPPRGTPLVVQGPDGLLRYKPSKQTRRRADTPRPVPRSLRASQPSGGATQSPGRLCSSWGVDHDDGMESSGSGARRGSPQPSPMSPGTQAAVDAIRASPSRRPRNALYSGGGSGGVRRAVGPANEAGSPPRPVTRIQRLPFEHITEVIEPANAPQRAAVHRAASPGSQYVLVSTAGNRPSSRYGLRALAQQSSRKEVRTLGPSHSEFERQAARDGVTPWTRMEAEAADLRRASRFRIGVQTPNALDALGLHGDARGTGSPLLAIKQEWDVRNVLHAARAPPVNRAKLQSMLTVPNGESYFSLRDVLEASEHDESSALAGEANEEVRQALQRKLANASASTDAELSSASASNIAFSPTKLYEARLKEQDERDRARRAAEELEAATEAEEAAHAQLLETARQLTSRAVEVAPDPADVERMRQIYELIIVARSRTQCLADTVIRDADVEKQLEVMLEAQQESSSKSHEASLSHRRDDAFDRHSGEMHRLLDTYFGARRHHDQSIGDRVRDTVSIAASVSGSPGINKAAIEGVRARLQVAFAQGGGSLRLVASPRRHDHVAGRRSGPASGAFASPRTPKRL
jgi:hypothetical protein